MSRSYPGLPMAYGDKQQQSSTYQTGTFLFRKLAKPLAFIILVSLVFGMYGITGITTLLRKTRSFQEDHHTAEVATMPVVKELCASQLASLKNCFPSYSSKKRARRCKNQYEAVAECRKEVEHAQETCRQADPDIHGEAEVQCVRNLVH